MQSSSTMKPERSDESESSESSDASDSSVSCDPSVIPDESESSESFDASDALKSSGSYDGSRSLSSSAHSTSPFPFSRLPTLTRLGARSDRGLDSISLYCIVIFRHIKKTPVSRAEISISRALQRDTDPEHVRYFARARLAPESTRSRNTPSSQPKRSKRAIRFDSFSFTIGGLCGVRNRYHGCSQDDILTLGTASRRH